jgi:hypothetical protein
MEPKKNVLLVALNGGLVTGLLLIIFASILYIFDLTTSRSLGIINYVILAACIFILSKKYRDKELGGFISYGQGLGFGVLVGLISAILLAIFAFIEYKYIAPELISVMQDTAREEMVKKAMSEAQIDQAMKMTSWLMNPIFISISTIFSLTFISFIISLITSAIVKKENNPV